VKDILIETGDVECSKKIFPRPYPNAPTHNRDGIVSMKLNDDGSLSTKFVITMQPMRIFDDSHIVVGRVIDGNNFIIDLDAHGTKFGIPEKMFFITVSAIKK
jgi:cyclophilin family peptidyl-prolyl cis-trans isomerase